MAKKKRRLGRKFLYFFLSFVLFLYLNNSNLFISVEPASPKILAHRAAGQAYERGNLTSETCTAAQSLETAHPYLENTLSSIKAAFEMGADIVEFDVQRTTDDRFALFHDWTLDCRTEGEGRTRDHDLAYLQSLDIGYGYSRDAGKSFPFRGKGVGLMPSLEEVLDSFPDKRFLIDIKSNDPKEGKLLAQKLATRLARRRGELMIYGGRKPVEEVLKQLPDLRHITRPKLKSCLKRYMLLGWIGYVPEACKNCVLTIPSNIAPWLWGWPYKFSQRIDAVNSEVVLLGPYGGQGFSTPFDEVEKALQLPENYSGYIWTDRIEILGPALKKD
ncbi:MAG: glycerophosphodiester phosphodiesterase family protein [Bacteroidota bacterium]